MSTKFFIGGNVWYDDEEEAEEALKEFLEKHGVPAEAFSIVKIHRSPSKAVH
jgi:hypothetical protein